MSAGPPRSVHRATTCALLLTVAASACGDADALAIGDTVNGELESSDPLLPDGAHFDLYVFRGDSGRLVSITLRSQQFDAYLAGGRMDGEDFVAESSDDDSGGGTDARLTITVGASGEYAVRVSSWQSGQTGEYTLLIENVELAGGLASELTRGSTVTGALETSDPLTSDSVHYDLYEYRGLPGEQIIVTMRSTEFDSYLAAGSPSGDSLAVSQTDDDGGGGLDARLILTLGPDGAQWIRASSLGAGVTGSYTVSLESGSAAPPDGTRTVHAGDVVAGQLLASDPQLFLGSRYQDYRISGSAGERLLITLTSTDFDAMVEWGEETGGVYTDLASDDDGGGGSNSRLEVAFARTGTYVIRVTSWFGDVTGAYTLSVEGVSSAVARLPQLRSGESFSGELTILDPVLSDNSHYQLFGYQGRPGEMVLVTLRSRSFDAYVHAGRMVAGSFVSELTDNDAGGGTDAQLLAVVGLDGTLAVEANSLRAGETGAFTLLVEPASGARSESPSGPGNQPAAAVGQRISGTLRVGDPMLSDSSYYNQYIYSGRPGDRVRITLRSTQFDSYLRWGRLNGNVFRSEQYDDDGGGGKDARLDVTVNSTGVYAIQVNTYAGGQTGAYELQLERLTDAVDTGPGTGGTGKWLAEYEETTNVGFRALGQRLKESGVLEEVSDALSGRFRIPRNIPVRLKQCNETNAFFDTAEESIAFCYELLEEIADKFVRDGRWTTQQQEDVFGAVRFILMHEVGHGLIRVLDLPVTGREEDVADQLAVVLLVEGGEKGANAALDGAAALQSEDNQFDDTDFADEHSLGPVRLFNVKCWIYGSDPTKYASMVTNGQLPSERAERCSGEFERMSKAWYRLLAPHTTGL
jgi:hypothetical protein